MKAVEWKRKRLEEVEAKGDDFPPLEEADEGGEVTVRAEHDF